MTTTPLPVRINQDGPRHRRRCCANESRVGRSPPSLSPPSDQLKYATSHNFSATNQPMGCEDEFRSVVSWGCPIRVTSQKCGEDVYGRASELLVSRLCVHLSNERTSGCRHRPSDRDRRVRQFVSYRASLLQRLRKVPSVNKHVHVR
jgi:hypothetical protein